MGSRFARASITGPIRAHSSSGPTGATGPGRVLCPPTSTASAPSSTISSPRRIARSRGTKRPPSENESGVTFKIPTTRARRDRSQEPSRWAKITRSRQAGALRGSDARDRRLLTGAAGLLFRGGRGGRRVAVAAISREWLERLAAKEPLDLLAVQDLALQECGGENVELVEVVAEELAGAVVGAFREPSHLLVDHDRGL